MPPRRAWLGIRANANYAEPRAANTSTRRPKSRATQPAREGRFGRVEFHEFEGPFPEQQRKTRAVYGLLSAAVRVGFELDPSRFVCALIVTQGPSEHSQFSFGIPGAPELQGFPLALQALHVDRSASTLKLLNVAVVLVGCTGC